MRLLFALTFLLAPLTVQAECTGQNLITALPPDQLAALQTAADAAPFARGNLWHATKADQSITLVGTFHLDDPRHDATVARLTAHLQAATTLLVEAGPAEEAALKAHVAAHPERLINQTGPTLPEALTQADWLRLAQALRARGIPPFFAAKLQPWYVATLLAVPACQFAEGLAMNGLDRRLIAAAEARGLTITALEPYDTIFSIFDSFAAPDQLAMLVQSLDAGATGDDMAITLADSYFAGESRLFWEFSKLQLQTLSGLTASEAASEFALVDAALVSRRNHAWTPRITAAAANGPLVVAFGALHLPGEGGVLNLLALQGWTVTPLSP